MSQRSTLFLILLAGSLVAWAFRLPPVIDPPSPSESWRSATLDTTVAGLGRGALTDVALTPEGRGIAPGTDRRVWRTSDDGHSWKTEPLPFSAQAAVAVRIGEDGTALMVLGNGRIVRSAEGGGAWTLVRPPGARSVRLAWADARTVLSIGDSLLRSTDTGATWSEVKAPKFVYWNAAFSRRGTGILIGGDGAVLRSTDDGASWMVMPRISREMLRGVAFADSQLVIVVGSNGAILRSVDDGEHWSAIASATTHLLIDVAMADARQGIAVGFDGTILRTLDGGLTWSSEPSGTRNHLMGVAIGADRAPVAVGFFDTILRGRPFAVPSTAAVRE